MARRPPPQVSDRFEWHERALATRESGERRQRCSLLTIAAQKVQTRIVARRARASITSSNFGASPSLPCGGDNAIFASLAVARPKARASRFLAAAAASRVKLSQFKRAARVIVCRHRLLNTRNARGNDDAREALACTPPLAVAALAAMPPLSAAVAVLGARARHGRRRSMRRRASGAHLNEACTTRRTMNKKKTVCAAPTSAQMLKRSHVRAKTRHR